MNIYIYLYIYIYICRILAVRSEVQLRAMCLLFIVSRV